MSTPDFILALRDKIGHAPLWLTGVTAVVLHEQKVLLVRRSDNARWTPVTGIVDPGEEPAVAAVREVLEETTVQATPERLVWVHSLPPTAYPNGDEVQFLDLVFRMRYDGGDPVAADGENTDARWFPLDALPELSRSMRARIRAAVANEVETRFEV